MNLPEHLRLIRDLSSATETFDNELRHWFEGAITRRWLPLSEATIASMATAGSQELPALWDKVEAQLPIEKLSEYATRSYDYHIGNHTFSAYSATGWLVAYGIELYRFQLDAETLLLEAYDADRDILSPFESVSIPAEGFVDFDASERYETSVMKFTETSFFQKLKQISIGPKLDFYAIAKHGDQEIRRWFQAERPVAVDEKVEKLATDILDDQRMELENKPTRHPDRIRVYSRVNARKHDNPDQYQAAMKLIESQKPSV